MENVRKAAVAGGFYPGDKEELHNMVQNLLQKAPKIESHPKAVIAPHAGYIYSGGVAASAYAPVKDFASEIKHVILLGPAHRVACKGLVAPSVEYFETPLGNVKINHNLIKKVLKLDQVATDDAPHAEEHSLEVHIPFLQEVLGNDFDLVPLVVGDASPEEVGEVLDNLWGGDDTLIVISTDLSHYHDYNTANKMDIATSYAIEDMNIDGFQPQNACGSRPVKGLLYTAKQRGMKVKMVDFCNSGDTAGDKNRVVGYGAYYCGEQDSLGDFYSKVQKKVMLQLAYGTIQYAVEKGIPPESVNIPFRFDSNTPVATFVTIEKNHQLRGCIGSLQAHRPILQDIMHNAYAAAFNDPRFPKVTAEELPQLSIHISILTEPKDMSFDSEDDLVSKLRPGIDGLILTDGNSRGTFLPTVWQSIPEPKDFLNSLKRKAGLPEDHWSDNLTMQRYETKLIDASVFQ